MKYLLDVNALIAWGQQRAPQHAQFHAWAAGHGLKELVTCAHSELGFLRISMQVFGDSLTDAQTQLKALKGAAGGFLEAAPSPNLPPWARRAADTTDAYLMQVAASAGLELATFDTGIPGATLIR